MRGWRLLERFYVINFMNKQTKLLKDLVSIPSISTQEQRAVDFLVDYARNLNFDEIKKDEAGNFIARRGNGSTVILLVGHIDTVPGDIPVEIKNNKLYGRGSVDAKGCLATFLFAAHQVKNIKDKTIIVVGCVEEEISSSKGARYILNCYNPNYIVIGEPSGWQGITIGYKGGLRFVYKNKQDLAHFSIGEPTIVDLAVNFVNHTRKRLIEFFSQQDGIFYQPHLEVRSFNTDNNGLEQFVEVKCNLRIPPGFDVQLFKEFLQNYPVEISEDISAVYADKNNKLVRLFLKSIRHYNGKPCFVKKTGSSDMNILAEYWSNVPILAYGPGNSKLDHTPNEYIYLEEYQKTIDIMVGVLEF